jgi:tripartite-type tricarboxylate transporter receptor subunit TctC
MRGFGVVVSFLLAIYAGLAVAQGYPSRPVKMIVTFPAGGASDIAARIFAERLADLWKQQVFVENRVGGGGSVGTEAAYRAEPDGHTLLWHPARRSSIRCSSQG